MFHIHIFATLFLSNLLLTSDHCWHHRDSSQAFLSLVWRLVVINCYWLNAIKKALWLAHIDQFIVHWQILHYRCDIFYWTLDGIFPSKCQAQMSMKRNQMIVHPVTLTMSKRLLGKKINDREWKTYSMWTDFQWSIFMHF